MYCKFSKAQCRIPIAFILGRPHYFEVSTGSDYIFCDAFALFRVHSFLLSHSNVRRFKKKEAQMALHSDRTCERDPPVLYLEVLHGHGQGTN